MTTSGIYVVSEVLAVECDAELADGTTCTFAADDMDVDVDREPRVPTMHWVCPECGTHHDGEAPEGPEPDDDYLNAYWRY